MKKLLKYLLLGLGGVLLVLAALAAFVAATFDPNQYKPQIIQAVKESKQRTLKLEGDIRLTFFPRIGAEVGRIALSEPRSEKEFAAAESVRVALALLPLLSRQAVVEEIVVKGARLNLVRFKDGRLNIDDLMAPEKDAKPTQFRLDIDHVLIENAALNYRDEARGAQYALSGLNLKTGRVASGVPGRIEFSAQLAASEPKAALALQASGGYLIDLLRKQYSLSDFRLEAKGEAAGITGLAVAVSGGVSARGADEFSVEKLVATLAGVQQGNRLEARLEAPRLSLARDKATGDKVSLAVKLAGAKQTLAANLALPGIEGTAQAFKAAAMTLDLDLKQDELAVKAKVSSPVTGSLPARQLNLPKLALSLHAAGPQLPVKSVDGEFSGSAALDGAKERVQAQLAGRLLDSNIKTAFAVQGFGHPAYSFDADIDQLDLDKLLPPKPAAGAGGAAGAPAKEEPIDFSVLKGLNATGSVRIGALKVRNVKSSQVRFDLKARDGRLDINPLSAHLYQGSLNGSVALNAAGNAVATRQNLANVSVGPLLKDLADYDALEGRGTVSLDLTSHGATVTALKKALAGSAALNLVDGAYKGINIAESLRGAKAKLGVLRGEQTQQASGEKKTDFSELTATFRIVNGVARNDDLLMKSPLLRLTGAGDINIGADTIDYLAKATVVGTSKGQGGAELESLKGVTVPVKLYGPLAAPQYKLDFGAMATEAVKQKTEDKLKGKLKGLFK